jgi:hypothetical protein
MTNFLSAAEAIRLFKSARPNALLQRLIWTYYFAGYRTRLRFAFPKPPRRTDKRAHSQTMCAIRRRKQP